MNEQFIEDLALYLTIPAVAIIVLLAFASVLGVPTSLRQRKKERQKMQLERACASNQTILEIEWIKHKELSWWFIHDLLGSKGWNYLDQAISGNSWRLRFTREDSATAHATPTERLGTQLADAQPDKYGRYRLDIKAFEFLTRDDIRRVARSAEWSVTAWLDTVALLVRVSQNTDQANDLPEQVFVPKVGNISPQSLLRSRGVQRRVAQIKDEQGFDPLDSAELDRVGEWQRYVDRKSGRPTIWSAIVGVLFLIAAFTALAVDGAVAVYVTLSVTVALGLATGIVGLVAWMPYRKRDAEVGDRLEALRKLQQVYQGPSRPSGSGLSGGLK